jgi:hypothetical protein
VCESDDVCHLHHAHCLGEESLGKRVRFLGPKAKLDHIPGDELVDVALVREGLVTTRWDVRGGPCSRNPDSGGSSGRREPDPEKERDGERDSERREGCGRGSSSPIGRSIGVSGITSVGLPGVLSLRGWITWGITGLFGSENSTGRNPRGRPPRAASTE